jgi:hypothetical protein
VSRKTNEQDNLKGHAADHADHKATGTILVIKSILEGNCHAVIFLFSSAKMFPVTGHHRRAAKQAGLGIATEIISPRILTWQYAPAGKLLQTASKQSIWSAIRSQSERACHNRKTSLESFAGCDFKHSRIAQLLGDAGDDSSGILLSVVGLDRHLARDAAKVCLASDTDYPPQRSHRGHGPNAMQSAQAPRIRAEHRPKSIRNRGFQVRCNNG